MGVSLYCIEANAVTNNPLNHTVSVDLKPHDRRWKGQRPSGGGQSSGSVWKGSQLRSCVKGLRAQDLCERAHSSGAVWKGSELRICVKGLRAQWKGSKLGSWVKGLRARDLCERAQSSEAVWKGSELMSCVKVEEDVPKSPCGLCGRKATLK